MCAAAAAGIMAVISTAACGMDADSEAVKIASDAPSGDEDLVVTTVYRISHPAFRVGAEWQANRTPYNRDMTRVLINEMQDFTDQRFGETRRGFVWGFVNDLKAWRTREEYKAGARPIVPRFNYSHMPGQSIYWSPFEGEESTSTEGKVHYRDVLATGQPLDWGTEGAFLAELVPVTETPADSSRWFHELRGDVAEACQTADPDIGGGR